MSKLNVGVGAEFPVDSADPEPADDERFKGCDDRHGYRRRHRFRGYGRHHGRMFYAGPLLLIAFIALISLAISYPGVVLALIAVAALGFALRHHHHHDDRPWDRRDDWREGADVGPQPDAPPAGTTARS